MSASNQRIEINQLRHLELLRELNADRLQELADKSRVIELLADREVFKQGDVDNRTLYLLSGELKLSNSSGATMVLKSNHQAAHSPIDTESPRIITAHTRTDVQLLSIDSDLLDMALNWGDDEGSYEVEEIDFSDDADWISQLLYTQGLLNLPPQSIQALVTRLQEVPLASGDVVLKEGEEDDFYYIIKQGRCQVSRVMPGDSEATTLCELKAGEGFGEEALITQGRRNATVTMIEDGVLLKLDKSDFNSLIASFLVAQVNGKEAHELLSTGTVLLDVRTPEEYHQNGVGRSMPIALLRREMSHFDPDRKYIVVCDDGKRSAAAAFLMRRMGMNVHALQGGLVMHRQAIEESLEKQGGKKAAPTAATEGVASPVKTTAAVRGEDELTLLKKQNLRLQNEVKKAEQQASTVKSQLESALTQQLRQTDESKQAHRRVATELAALRQQMETMQQSTGEEGETFNQQLGEIKGELEQALQRAVAAETTQGTLEQQISRLHDDMTLQRSDAEQRANEQNENLERANALLESLRREHTEALEAQQCEIEQAQQRSGQAESELNAHSATIESLKSSYAESEQKLQNELQQARERVADAESALADREASLDAVKGEQSQSLSQLEEGVEAAKTRAVEAERAAEQLKTSHSDELVKLQQELEQHQLQLSESEAALAVQRTEMEQLQSEQQSVITGLESELGEMRERANGAESRQQQLEQDRASLEATIARQKDEVELSRQQFEAELAAVQEEVVSLRTRIAELGNENERVRVEFEAEIGQLTVALDHARRESERHAITLSEAEQREAELKRELDEQQRALDEIREQHKHEIETALLKIKQLHGEKAQLSNELTSVQSESEQMRSQLTDESEGNASQMAELRVLFEQYKRENAKLKAEIVAKSIAEQSAPADVDARSAANARRRRHATRTASSAWMQLSSENNEGEKKSEVDWNEMPTFEMGAEYGEEDVPPPIDPGWTRIKTK
ncbi:hypothetical protein BOW53_04040 [Solemya pervernicosa gill symbiont]|uniref:Cyclic nucleotide-binding domain-containing protein n=2 Tax=Gammaproteobacteria incertae sedis TaxID=118884 RepID=A0A1T2L8I1_9GAMM|nr:cyclic nucleotide-binding domain-containing protein [Candidatus Reidiella endopervernicosa]OOZ41427.1 hypothetical protein BOW53_04040 [Solemya pervernicosa gill symbiont]QKQ27534.1 cyclic nucleotide-binding domain-containing protein [Candidatus Reidiella endopervernicosa]